MTTYLTIMMKHLEQMQIEVSAAAEMRVSRASLKERETAYDCDRFLFVKEGEGRLIVQGQEIPLTKGMFCVLLSGTAHRIELEPHSALTVQWCHFRGTYGDRDLYRTLNLPFYLQVTDFETTTALFDRLIKEMDKQQLTSRLRIKACMLELISIFLEHLPDIVQEGSPTQDLQKIKVVLQYIDEHLADSITVEDLAKQVFLHPNYFIVFFKGILGCSPIQYVNQRRMETAKSLLLQPECNVSDVASRVGMQIYYFSRMFKAQTGLTPSRYRKQAANVPIGSKVKRGDIHK